MEEEKVQVEDSPSPQRDVPSVESPPLSPSSSPCIQKPTDNHDDELKEGEEEKIEVAAVDDHDEESTSTNNNTTTNTDTASSPFLDKTIQGGATVVGSIGKIVGDENDSMGGMVELSPIHASLTDCIAMANTKAMDDQQLGIPTIHDFSMTINEEEEEKKKKKEDESNNNENIDEEEVEKNNSNAIDEEKEDEEEENNIQDGQEDSSIASIVDLNINTNDLVVSSTDQKNHNQQLHNHHEQVQQQLGVTSQTFIQRLRGAAFRRKMGLTKSRDTLLAAKTERQQEKANSIAASQQLDVDDGGGGFGRRQSEPVYCSSLSTTTSKDQQRLHELNLSRQFHAKPAPETTGVKGAGGLEGVPKVFKKKATKPISPKLGNRRNKNQLLLQAQQQPVQTPASTTGSTGFRALPLPLTTGPAGHGGLTGIPKVPKRSMTKALSPLLGPRRKPTTTATVPVNKKPPPAAAFSKTSSSSTSTARIPKSSTTTTTTNTTKISSSADGGCERQQQLPTQVDPRTNKSNSSLQRSSIGSNDDDDRSLSALKGLSFVDSSSRCSWRGGAARQPLTPHNPNGGTSIHATTSSSAFVPWSTLRAQKRSNYEAIRKQNEQQRQQEESRDRQERIRTLKKELGMSLKDTTTSL